MIRTLSCGLEGARCSCCCNGVELWRARKAVVTAVVIAAGIHADVCCSNVCSPGGELGGSPPACALPRKFRAAVGSLVLR